MFPLVYQAGILPAGRNRILPPRLDPGQLFYAPLMSNLSAIGAGDVTPAFTRASVATYRTGAGELGTVGSGVPRFEQYGMLFEPVTTNILKYSEDFSHGPEWVLYQATLDSNVAASPYIGGSVVADKVKENTNNDWHGVYQEWFGTAGRRQAMTCFVKAGERTWTTLNWWDYIGNTVEVWYDLATGAVGSNTVVGTATIYRTSIEQFANGWWRCELVVTAAGNNQFGLEINSALSDGVSQFVGTTGYGVYVFGAQAEDNPAARIATSYIPTVASTVQRPQDILVYPGPGNTPLGPIGSIECEWRRKEDDIGVSILSTANVVNQYGAEILQGAAFQLLSNVISNSLQQQAVGPATNPLQTYHGVWAFQPFTCGLYLDDTLVGTASTNSNLPNHSKINVGSAGTNGNAFHGHIRNVKIWEIRLWL